MHFERGKSLYLNSLEGQIYMDSYVDIYINIYINIWRPHLDNLVWNRFAFGEFVSDLNNSNRKASV